MTMDEKTMFHAYEAERRAQERQQFIVFMRVCGAMCVSVILILSGVVIGLQINKHKGEVRWKNGEQLRNMFSFHVINLDMRTDKLLCVTEQFRHHNLLVKRTPALRIDTVQEMQSLWVLDEGSKQHVRENPNQIGHVGCLLSHLSILLQVEKSTTDARIPVIFEDDVVLGDDFGDILLDIHEELPADWDFVAYGWYCNSEHWTQCHDNDDREWISTHLVHVRFYMGNYAYSVSERGARKILDAFPCSQRCGSDVVSGCSMALDWVLSCMIRNGELNAYGAMPSIAFTPQQGENQAYKLKAPSSSLIDVCIDYRSNTERVWDTSSDTVDQQLLERSIQGDDDVVLGVK